MDFSIQSLIFGKKIDDLRKKLIIPGIAAAVIRKGEVWSKYAGYADISSKRKVDTSTTFSIASITKTVTATVLLSLSEERILNIDTPISRFGISCKESDRITIRHLLSHTSRGIVGEEFCYSGRRFLMLQRILENLLQKPIEQIMMERLMKPLKLNTTAPCSYRKNPEFAEIFQNQAKPYRLSQMKENTEVSYSNFFSVTDGLVSTLEDMITYSISLDNNIIISEEGKNLAWTNTKSTSGKLLPCGLGWFIQWLQGWKLVWHYGVSNGFSSILLKIPEKELSLILLTNNEELTNDFDLEKCDATVSPFISSFIEVFVN